MHIRFQIYLVNFEQEDALSTRAALREAFKVTDHDIDAMIADARNANQWFLEFWCSGDQFSVFLIQRNNFGARNLFANLKPRIVDFDTPMECGRVVDFVRLKSSPEWTKPYNIHPKFPASMVASANATRERRMAMRHHREAMQARREASRRDGTEWHLRNEITRLKDKLLIAESSLQVAVGLLENLLRCSSATVRAWGFDKRVKRFIEEHKAADLG